MSRLAGTIALAGLPPHRGLILNLCFFAVNGPDAPAPYNGDPPAEAATDCDKVLEQVELDNESQETTFDHRFAVERPPGYYYLQVRAILLRTRDGKVFAQAEQFFFARQSVQVGGEPEGGLTLPVSWPTEPLETLHHYGTLRPQRNRPWSRFW